MKWFVFNGCAVVAQYGRVNFWDTYFAEDVEPFEWYFDYSTFKETINENIKKEAKVMIAGCGNSHMLEDVRWTLQSLNMVWH